MRTSCAKVAQVGNTSSAMRKIYFNALYGGRLSVMLIEWFTVLFPDVHRVGVGLGGWLEDGSSRWTLNRNFHTRGQWHAQNAGWADSLDNRHRIDISPFRGTT